MEEQPQDVASNAQEAEKPKRKGSFAVGHPKYGGRQKKDKVSQKMWQAREIAQELDFHPLIEAIKIYRTGRLPSAPGVKAQPVSATSRVRCLEQALAFLLPRLSHQAISSPEGGPVETIHLDLVELMRNPDLARAAQTLALGISNPDYVTPFKQIEAQGRRVSDLGTNTEQHPCPEPLHIVRRSGIDGQGDGPALQLCVALLF